MQDRAGLAVAAIGGVNQRMKDLSLSHSLFSYNSAFQVNTSLKLEQKKKLNFLKKKKKHNARTKREIRQRFEFQENHKFHEDKYYIHSVSLCTFKDYLCVVSAKNRTSHLVAEQTNTC